jgi:hypothetical protein
MATTRQKGFGKIRSWKGLCHGPGTASQGQGQGSEQRAPGSQPAKNSECLKCRPDGEQSSGRYGVFRCSMAGHVGEIGPLCLLFRRLLQAAGTGVAECEKSRQVGKSRGVRVHVN